MAEFFDEQSQSKPDFNLISAVEFVPDQNTIVKDPSSPKQT